MDIISHGLYGGALFGQKNKKSFWLSFILGMAPDLIAFAPYFFLVVVGVLPRLQYATEPPYTPMPEFVHTLYNISHSLVIFVLLFLILWAIFRRPIWELLAWGLHILVDIPTHSYEFFPTPFLWPFSSVAVDGHPWGTPEVFIPNIIALILVFAWYFWRKQKNRSGAL